jgi:hypothetical protein
VTEENAEQRLAKRIGGLDKIIRLMKRIVVEKYGTPWWKARSGNVGFEQLYARMLAARNAESHRGTAKRTGHLEPTGSRSLNTAGKEHKSVSNTNRDLEKRVTNLEKSVQEMQAFLCNKVGEPWWKRTAGAFKRDKVFEQIMREVRKARHEDYEAVCREIDRFPV